MHDLDEILAFLTNNIDGALAAAVGGMDGLLVEQHAPRGDDFSALAAEITNVLHSARTAYTNSLDAGNLKELIVTADRLIGYTRMLGNDLFCIILLKPGGNIAKARLYSEQASKQILEVFV